MRIEPREAGLDRAVCTGFAEATTTSASKPTRTSRTPDAPLRTVYTFVDNGSAPAQPGS
jgi:hypothetical protein